MITKKQFYFVRHGQTDHNLLEGDEKGDHLDHIPLNQTGRKQAAQIEPLVATLPIQTICASPMKRAQETKEIISARLKALHHEIEDLGECSAKIWREMTHLGTHSPLPPNGEARMFMERVRRGLNTALSLPGPALIVAHGGVHWAICSLIQMTDHEWKLENCGVVHFSLDPFGNWKAKKLSAPHKPSLNTKS